MFPTLSRQFFFMPNLSDIARTVPVSPPDTETLSSIVPQNGAANTEAATPNASALLRAGVSQLKPYVPGKPIEEVKRELGLPTDFTLFKLASNENVLGPSPRALEAAKNALNDIWLYPDDTCFDLKRALAHFWKLTPEHFLVGNGSDEIIHFLSLALLDSARGDETIYGAPSFVQYKAAAMVANCPHHAVPLTSDMRHDLAAMKAKVNERTKLIFIANPNNPTGTVVTRDEFEKLLDGLPSHVVVVLDQAYLEYVDDERSPNGLDYINEHNVIVLQTFSKAYALAGLRVGYAIARPEMIALLAQVRGPFNVNMAAQAAAVASLSDEEQVVKARDNNSRGRAYLCAQFDAMGLEYVPTQANFVLVNTQRPSKQMFDELLRGGVIVRTGDPFGLPTWLRVTIGTPEMNERFISSLRAILM